MTDVRILTIQMDPRTGLFDDGPLRAYLANREVLRSEPQFFVHEGHPCFAVYLETRPLQGAAEGAAATSRPAFAPGHPDPGRGTSG